MTPLVAEWGFDPSRLSFHRGGLPSKQQVVPEFLNLWFVILRMITARIVCRASWASQRRRNIWP